jgi:predicted transposase/invertase (TIGR01784 family)
MMTFAEKMEERGIQKAKLKRLLKGMLEGEARGKKEGIEQAKQDAALRMLNEGVELAFISKVTDLSLAELKRLQEKN